MSEKKKWCVYKHTSPEGKIYIGITNQDPPEERWGYGYGYKKNDLFWNDIQKFGWNNFKHEIYFKNETYEYACQIESFLIHHYNSNNQEYGYNRNSGGGGLEKGNTVGYFQYEDRTTKLIAYKNQKIIQVHRDIDDIDFEANEIAMRRLSSKAFVLYMYIFMQPNKIFALSSKEIFDKSSLTECTYPKAVKELIDKKYLIPKEIIFKDGTIYDENTYHLWEFPEDIRQKGV